MITEKKTLGELLSHESRAACRLEEAGHVLRQRGLQLDPLSSDRVNESEVAGVQRLTRDESQQLFRPTSVLLGDAAHEAAPAVVRIAENGMSQVLEVDADLVSAAGVGTDPGVGCGGVVPQWFEAGSGRFAARSLVNPSAIFLPHLR